MGNVEFDQLMIRQYVVGYLFPKEPGKPDMAAIGAAAEKMKPQVAVLDRAVAATGHLVGDSLTLADINILPMLFYVNRFEEGKALLGAAKNLSAYMERHFARESFRKSAPPPRAVADPLPARGALPSPASGAKVGRGRRDWRPELPAPNPSPPLRCGGADRAAQSAPGAPPISAALYDRVSPVSRSVSAPAPRANSLKIQILLERSRYTES